MNLVYSCVFFNQNYINLLSLLLNSYYKFGNCNDKCKYLVICNQNLKDKVELLFKKFKINGYVWCLNLHTILDAACARLKIFDYPDISSYKNILYLDCDILIADDISNVWDINKEDKIYAIHENAERNSHFYFFNDDEYKNIDKNKAFTSCILLFKNSVNIKNLFKIINRHIDTFVSKKIKAPYCLDQPFIVYHAINNNLFNNVDLQKIAANRRFNNYNEIIYFQHIVENIKEQDKHKFKNKGINHFATGVGHYDSKLTSMQLYSKYILNL